MNRTRRPLPFPPLEFNEEVAAVGEPDVPGKSFYKKEINKLK